MTVIALNPRKLPRQERSRALFDAILDAAARILAEQGRDALNTNLVAEKAGVSIGSLYQYFPNRDAIIAAVADRHGRRIYHHVADMDLHAEPNLKTAIARIVRSLFTAHRLEPALHAALDRVQMHSHKDHDHHGGTKDAMTAQILDLPPLVRNEIKRPDIALAAVVVAEIVHSLAHLALVHPHSHSKPGKFEREAVSAALAYLCTTL